MNKIFKVIWNPATGSYSVASETAKSRGKKSGRSKLLISALIVTSAIFTPGAYAGLSLDGGDIFESTPLTNYWLAIGQGSVATTNNGGTDGVAMAIGLKAKALGAGSTAFGYDAEASGDRAIAFGQLTEASGNRTIAMGSGATATGDHSLALGGATKTLGMYSVAIGRDATTDSDYALSMGHMAKANGLYSLAMGAGSATSNDNAIAIGKKTQAQGVNSIALGNASQASGYSSLAIGELSETGAENAIALGKLSNASKINSIALGSNSTASGEGSVALGENSFAGGINSLALGSQSNANGDNAVALGVGSVAAQDNTVSVGNSTTQRKITNMAAGQIRNGSTEAINGSQLYGLSDSVAARLGGGAGVNEDGSINAPSYKLKSNIYNNVGDALLGIDNDTLHWDKTNKAFSASYLAKNADGSLKERSDQNKIINVAKGTISATSTDVVNGSQLYDLQQDALLWNGTAFSAAHGSDTTSKITNVAKGTVSATSTDVVNGSQLYDLQQDALLWNGTAFSAAHGTEATSKITNVEDGTISDTSKDAVNGSQLKETKDDVATNTANIADNTADIATNTTNIADNTADIATNTTDIATNTANIADNTANIATNTTDIATNTADIATNASSITTLNADVDTLEKDALLWNGTAFSAKHGTEATSKITNVTAGDLTAGSTDAVNGSQLKTTNDNVSTNTTNITNLTDSVGDLKDDSLLWNKAAGAFSAAHGTDTTSKITNVRAGSVSKNSTDAINGSQLYGVADSFTSYLGGGADISDTGVLTGSTYTIGDTDYTNVGDALAAINTSFSSSLGDALLWDATAGKFSAKHGINNDPSVITDVANGAVSSTSSDAINGSQLYGVSDYIADALGGNAVVNADGSITTPTYAIAGGSYDNVGDALEAIDTTLDDALLWDETANGGNGAFSAAHGKDKTASVITNVANGAVSATSSDAINGSQLYSTNKYIADALGGDAEVNADGTITAPTYTIANTDYNNVGEALDALDNNALLWDATANNGAGAYSASHDGKASIITNVADGNIGEDSTDAINGSQLNATNMMIQQNSEIINQLAGDTSKNYIGDNGAGINYVRTNDSGLAFNDASAAGIGSTAVGYNTVAKGDSSVAIGHGSNSIVETSIALGSESVSSRLIVKGSRNTRVTENGVEIGYDTTDGELLGALSIGDDGKYRQIINVADGSEAHDAVTVRQLQNAIGAVATTPTKYYHANSTAEDSLAVGEDSLAMGAKTIVNGNAGIGIGLNTLVLADAINGIAIGSNARANHADSIAMGNGSQTTRGAQTNYTAYNMDAPQNSVGEFSVGSEDGQRQITNVAAGSADTDAVNVGQLKVTDAQVSQNTQSITNLNTQVTNLDTRVTNIENGIGDIVTTGSTKYFKTNTDGADANAQGKDSVAIGSGSIAAADNSVALGTGSVADEENTISVGSSTNQRRITNVAAGVNATDAVNVSQLKSSEAGGVRYDTKADGSIDYSNITLGGGNGGTTRISNVSAGVNNNDAVNYAQLKQSVQETKQYTDQRMVEMDNKLSKTESKLSGGIASAMAMTGLPQAYTPGASMASIGGGTYNGESAVALGVSMVSANGRWVYKLQGSTNSQGEYSAALGAGIQW
ncbi:YadA-like family protein [Escherichia coli]|uniref:YadA-like family protein n=1 Tax=Escherichia coli TaxID=562 RepID=UPI0003EF11E8|nr:YadA-like family protein [Escherichia coli]EHL2019806.1 YadA-like family protein [Escherichia coli]HBC5841411.1 YadA-like family protein [Escherichia coli]HBC6885940.1 YadA-like family protein [Escherichia coli]HCS7043939.1 YadA-like family protein [Escherichia coli]